MKRFSFFIGSFVLTTIILIIFLVILPCSVSAAMYYVDATGGSNSNNGTSTATAWKTLSKVNTAMTKALIVAGDNILFKRGETFTGNLQVRVTGTAGNILTFGAYGTGAKPIISAAGTTHGVDIRTGLNYVTVQDIKVTGATTNAVVLLTSASHINLTNLDLQSSSNGIAINTGTFSDIFISGVSTTSVNRGLTATNSITSITNLTLDNVNFSSSTQYGLLINNGGTTSNVTISNSTFSNNDDRGILLKKVSNLSITDTVVSNNDSRGIDLLETASTISLNRVTANSNASSGISLGTGLSDVTINNSTFNNNGTNGISFVTGGTNATVINTTASYNLSDGFNVHDAWTNVVFDRCIAEQNGVSGLGGDGDGFSYHNMSTGIIRYSVAKNNLKSAVAQVEKSSVNMYYNLFYSTTSGTLPLVYVRDAGIHTLYNNVIYNAGATGTGVKNNGATLTMRNNIVMGFNYGVVHTLGTTNEDYNLIYGATTANWSGLSQGVHSLSQNPQFTDTNTRDFTLLPTSPAINTGTDVGLTRDFVERSVPNSTAVDMGAYEYYLLNSL